MYKKESYILFQNMMDRIGNETVRYLFFLQSSRSLTSGRLQQ
jgi:preprotein translocase subunit SecA